MAKGDIYVKGPAVLEEIRELNDEHVEVVIRSEHPVQFRVHLIMEKGEESRFDGIGERVEVEVVGLGD